MSCVTYNYNKLSTNSDLNSLNTRNKNFLRTNFKSLSTAGKEVEESNNLCFHAVLI